MANDGRSTEIAVLDDINLHQTGFTRATSRREPCESRKICRGHPLPVPFFYQIHDKKIFDLGNKGQDQEVLHSQWCYSMTNINLAKSHMTHFSIASTVFEILTLPICDLDNLGKGYRVPHSQWSHSVTNINLYKSHT